MFHCPSILGVKKQAKVLDIPLLLKKTKGEKEKELEDLEEAIAEAKNKYGMEGIVTGAVESVYQSSRIQKICNRLGIECFNPLWQRDQFELLEELIKNKFEIILTGVFAYPLDNSWIEKKIDKDFIEKMKELNRKYKINPAGEGGEFETLVLNCPLFKRKLKVVGRKIFGEENSFSAEVELK